MKKAVSNFIFGLFSSAFMRLSPFPLYQTRMDTVDFSLQVGESLLTGVEMSSKPA